MRFRTRLPLLAILVIAGCHDLDPIGPPGVQYSEATAARVRFATIGDFGKAGQDEADVATLVMSWNPDHVLTTGDNNYENGSANSIDRNIGQYYHSFIHPYVGSYGVGGSTNRFWPSLGNHDYRTDNAQPYFDYFTLPGNERYYDFRDGPVHFIALNSNSEEPDGIDSLSIQASWLRNVLAASTAPWKVVFFHHSPYSSSQHGNYPEMQWPFKRWGADVVITGHDHVYERLIIDGLPYIVNGLGGKSTYKFGKKINPGSVVRFNEDFGAQLVTATADSMTLQFYTRAGTLVDTHVLTRGDSTIPADTTRIEMSFQNGALPDPSYAGNIDTHLSEHRSTTNYGEAATLLIDGSNPSGKDKRALLKWDLSAIPRTATVTGASITFYVEDTSPHTYGIYRIKRNWKEGTATWDNYDAGASWFMGGASALLDRATKVLGTMTARAPGWYTLELNSEGVKLVQGWVNGSVGNKGVMIMDDANTDGVDVASSEAPIVAHRPKLTVTYSR